MSKPQHSARYSVQPGQPVWIDLDRGPKGEARITSDRPFSLGQLLCAEGFPHRYPDGATDDLRRKPRRVALGVLGDAPALVKVAWL